MKTVWKHHFKYYDLFQNNSDRYRKTIELHVKELKNFQKILDTGAGSGNLTLELLKQRHEVVAIDLDEYTLSVLKEKCKDFNEKLKVIKMDVEKLEFDNESFDGISSMFVIPFVKNNKKYLSEVYRVLRKDGKFTLSVWAPVKDSWYGVMDMLEEELREKDFLPKYQKEWNFISKSSKVHAETVMNGIKKEDLKKLLEEIGFKNISNFSKNPYTKYAYSLFCEK